MAAKAAHLVTRSQSYSSQGIFRDSKASIDAVLSQTKMALPAGSRHFIITQFFGMAGRLRAEKDPYQTITANELRAQQPNMKAVFKDPWAI